MPRAPNLRRVSLQVLTQLRRDLEHEHLLKFGAMGALLAPPQSWPSMKTYMPLAYSDFVQHAHVILLI